MSWEEGARFRRPCPCGTGEYEEVLRSDDWGRTESSRTMLCPRCKTEYVWSRTVIAGHPGDETERGWTRTTALSEEKRYEAEITERVRARVGAKWREQLAAARTRKAKWEILTVGGRGYPSLSTFYQHTRGMSPNELDRYFDGFVSFHHLGRLTETFSIKPADVGVVSDPKCPVCAGALRANHRGFEMCGTCKFIRPRPSF